LANRGITDALEAEAFLNPDFETGIHDPFKFARMKDAVARVFAAIESKERITVHGDYDADGVTGSTVVISVLRELERKMDPTREASLIDYYIPHRDKEGYGLRMATVDILKERGTSLIITVDCGIACVDEVALAKTYGIETIVLDHHEFGEKLPDGFLIHPRLPGESYPFEFLAAVGVSWKFSCAVIAEARSRGLDFPPGWEKWLLDLVSIATVTDMVPLVGENRVLLTYGLKVLNKTRRRGLLRLVEAARGKGELTSESIGFGIGPRINAAGRMEHAEIALKLMLAEEEEDAKSSSASAGGNAAALAAVTGSTEMSASFKNFRHHPDMENFYRFIYENDLRLEALAIINDMMTERANRKAVRSAKANAH
jgi:single-stranded-DNA-specific exonuclease